MIYYTAKGFFLMCHAGTESMSSTVQTVELNDDGPWLTKDMTKGVTNSL